MHNQKPDIMDLMPNPNAVYIDETNLASGILFKNRPLLSNVKFWHKFVINNTEGLSRNQILRAILDHVHPLDLIPVFFGQEPGNSTSYFLARNCQAAAEKLCRDNLVIENPLNTGLGTRKYKSFKISIILNFASTNSIKIDVQKNVSQVLAKRLCTTTKVLDLDKFHEDPDLTEFCPLSQPKIMYFVLHIAKNLSPEEIILSNNNIRLLNPVDVLIGLKLKRIDVSHNNIASIDDLGCLKRFNLTSLKLTGNPLCSCDEEDYVSKIRLICPTLEILDGILISADKYPVTKRYYFCEINSTDLVNQFLEHFYTVYDSSDRRYLANLYHQNAMFSLTCVYLAGQMSSANAYLKLYSNLSRNLKTVADFSKTFDLLFLGREKIMDAFAKLPLTEHDQYSFTADLMYNTDKQAGIVVTGCFHEKPTSLLDRERFLGFSRSFVLEKIDSKYVITNDLLHVYNGLTYQEKNSFLDTIEPVKVIHTPLIPKPQKESDFNDLVVTLSHLTNLKGEWSRKCLEECSYDLKESIELFVKLHKANKMPPNAFIGPM